MGRGINRRLYAEHFLKTLRAKVLQKQKQYPKWFAANARLQNDIAKARTLADFDEWYTAPAHDFASAADYWQSGSCADSLQRVKLPLLCINAMNDPIVPPSSLPNPKTTPPNIRIRRPQTGAHAAFTGTPKKVFLWAEMRLLIGRQSAKVKVRGEVFVLVPRYRCLLIWHHRFGRWDAGLIAVYMPNIF